MNPRFHKQSSTCIDCVTVRCIQCWKYVCRCLSGMWWALLPYVTYTYMYRIDDGRSDLVMLMPSWPIVEFWSTLAAPVPAVAQGAPHSGQGEAVDVLLRHSPKLSAKVRLPDFEALCWRRTYLPCLPGYLITCGRYLGNIGTLPTCNCSHSPPSSSSWISGAGLGRKVTPIYPCLSSPGLRYSYSYDEPTPGPEATY